MNETLRIDTPENVIFGYTVAGIGSRFMAALVDTTIIVILEILAYFLMVLLLFEVGKASWNTWLVALFSLVGFLFLWGYYIFFELLWNGQSLGKRWVGLRVIRMDGMPIGLAETLIRNLVRLVDFMPVGYGVGVIAMFVTSQSRRLGDLAAGTLVVYDRGSIPLPAQPVTPRLPARVIPLDRPDYLAQATEFPLHLLTNQDILLAQELLGRYREMVDGEKLAAQILAQLYRRMGLTGWLIEPGTGGARLAALMEAIHNLHSRQAK
jgi:uncharacterized RDD family membrane protein YckC